MDLNKVTNDQVTVSVSVPVTTASALLYSFPKIIPGTYSEDDYGKYIEKFKAFDAKGNALTTIKVNDNSWKIENAAKARTISYQVNDTYDIEDTHEIFSPAGSNIEVGKNFMINTHAFVGYFDGFANSPYQLTIIHPEYLWGATAMEDLDASKTKDVFQTNRYATLVENPIMYAKPDYTTFTVQGMEIVIAVYSPNGLVTAESITPEMKTMITTQKNFLGDFNATKKYVVLLYLSDNSKPDAQGFGALEHPTATTVVMPELLPKSELVDQLKDVVSHEFFHIVTPLSIHSKEIQDFDYNAPKMSKHLWMYEGVTEYFANLFQINQGLITEEEFYKRMSGKIANASRMNDMLPFTKMSTNVLIKPYKDEYLNVYEKGALIAMCIDIEIREKSNGKRGILDLMKLLSLEYGTKKAFDDSELFGKITQLTYPEVGIFLEKYVSGPTPIPYSAYFAKMGVTKTMINTEGNLFIKEQAPLISIDPDTKEISFIQHAPLQPFLKNIGIEPGDVLLSVNTIKYNLDNINDLIIWSTSLKEEEEVTFIIRRNGVEKQFSGKAILPQERIPGYQFTETAKESKKQAWLKG
ncbi:peptidase M61 [Flavobacterium tegetincola]|uniref:M61 family metallopeptidase n=1 Tax=Flavobacterium tegetincola TaxID=150172 RepID=UPI001FE18DE0|nr:peptidase M61 [Flavobacterium tegetincola]